MAEPITTLKTTLLVSALTGGVVAALIGGGSWTVRIVRGVVGAAASFYLTPIAAPILEHVLRMVIGPAIQMGSEGVHGATGFLLGVTGMIVVETARDMARKVLERAPGKVGDKIDRL